MAKDDVLWVKRYIISRLVDIYTPDNIIKLEVSLYEINGYTSYNFTIITANEHIRDMVCGLLMKERAPEDKCINGMVYYDEFWHYVYFLQLNIQEKGGYGNWIMRED